MDRVCMPCLVCLLENRGYGYVEFNIVQKNC